MNKLSATITRVETAVAGVCLSGSTLLIFLAAVARSVSRPINWSLDISLFLFAWATFLSADVAFRDNKLVNVDVLSYRLPRHISKSIEIGILVLILLFLMSLVIFGIISAYTSRLRAFQGIPNVSYSWITLSLPVGSLLLIQTTVEKLRHLANKNPGRDDPSGKSGESADRE